MQEKIKCWEFFECDVTECPAYMSKELWCWLMSGTHCRDEIQGKFLEKIEMCIECEPLKANLDVASVEETLRAMTEQFAEFKGIVQERDRELESISMELALGLSEVFEALKQISSGDPLVRISETSELELIAKLKHMVNLTAENLGEIVDLSHEFAIGLAEHFDVLRRVSEGDLSARVFGTSQVELLEILKHVTNQMIESVSREITERKRAEEALQEERNKLQAIVGAIEYGLTIQDRDYNIIYQNEVLRNTFGGLGQKCYRVYEGKDKPCEGCPVQMAWADGKSHTSEREIVMPSGEIAFWANTANPIRDASGEIVACLEIARNITKRKRAEGALVGAKEDWENTFDAITDMVMLLDSEHQVIRVNRTGAEALNTSKESLVGKKCYEAVHRLSHPISGCPLVLTMKTLEPHTAEITESRLGGSFICSTSPILDREGKLTGYTHSLKDITQSKRLEAQLQQAQKMEAIGTLAGGIAHDFNNLLTGIQGNVSLMLLDKDDTHPDYERLRNIEKQVQGGARLTSHLLGYARKGRYEVKPLSLNELVEETSHTFGRTQKAITIHQELAEDLFAIEADPGQIEQVLWNVYVNAADAMPRGGNLFLKTTNATHKDMKGKLYKPKPGNYVLLTVTDTGMGMGKKTMERVFDPFFTTKEMGRGTGLGLASAYGIIKAHGGYIDVDSTKEQGATFSIYLPASERKAHKAVKTAERFIRGTETVLLVDDEDVVLEVGQELLEAMGYQVLTAKDGKEAVKVFSKNRDKIDIVVLDVVMPNMGGGEAYDRMKEIDSDIKVVLSSGFSIDGEASEILERGCDAFIQKPFNMGGLSGRIREVLDKE
jgi:PAS domain S-box-containing protein